jgi:hypothetical protein
MSSVGLCVQFLLYPTLIIYCPENCIIIFIEKRFPSLNCISRDRAVKMPPSTSKVWKFFKRCNDSKTVKCQLCEVELTYTGVTTNIQVMSCHIHDCYSVIVVEFVLRKIIWSMQDDDSLLRSFVTIKPAAEKILSDGTAKSRRARTGPNNNHECDMT